MLTTTSIRTLIAVTVAAAATVAVLPAGPADAGRYGKTAEPQQQTRSSFNQSKCVTVQGFGDLKVCLSRTIAYRNGGWVQTTARHWVTNCNKFASPNQAHVYQYGVYGAKRGGEVVLNSRWTRDNFELNNCSNTDRINHRVKQPCMLTKITGNAYINQARNQQYRLYLMVGLRCPAPTSTGKVMQP